jgi:hypothetical protein
MKKFLTVLAMATLLLGACSPAKSEGISVTVYRSPT